MSKNDKKKVYIQINIVAIAILISIAGLIMLIVSSIESISGDIWDAWLKNLLQTIGTTLTSAGLVSILIEVSTIKGIIEKTVKGILEGDIDFGFYSKKALDKMKWSIAAQRCNPTQKEELLKNSIYKIEDKMIESVVGLYYEYNKADFIIENKNDCFIKTAKLDYEIVNKNKCENKITKTVYLFGDEDDIPSEERKKKFIIKKLIINGTDFTTEANKQIRIKEVDRPKNSVYKYVISFEKDLDPNVKSHKIKMEIEYEVPITDLTHMFKFQYPCKRAEHNIFIQGDNWELDCAGFAEFDCDFDNDKNKCEVKQTVKNNVKVNFKDWCLPGAGYVTSYKCVD